MTNPNPYTGTGHDDSGQAATRSPQDAPLAPADSRVAEGYRTADPARTDTDSGQAGGGYAPLAPAGQRPADPAAPSQPATGGLTDEEVAEFRRLRQEEKDRNQQIADAEAEVERNKPPISHYLHLANGDVVESAGVMTHYQGMTVVNAVPVEAREEEK